MTRTTSSLLPPSPSARLLARIHLWWLSFGPLVACAVIGAHERDAALGVHLVGLPLIVYILLINKYYLLPGSALSAAFTTLILPLQILVMTVWMDQDTAFFLVSEMAAEVVAMNLALTLIMMIHRPSGLGGVLVVGIFCAIPAWFAFVTPAVAMSQVGTTQAGPYIAMIIALPTLLWMRSLNQAAREARPPDPIQVGALVPLDDSARKRRRAPIPAKGLLGVNVEGIGFILLMLIAPIIMFWLGVGWTAFIRP